MASFDGCKWTLARDVAHFSERAAKEADKAILLCVEQDKHEQRWAGIKNKFTAAAAQEFFCRVERALTTSGACGS